jgi:Co/Zn/Cd efflux system component
MNANCCHDCLNDDPLRGDPTYRRVLWIVLAINALMFAVEIGAGLAAGSASLQADALDFLGDAGNYAISLFVVGMALRYRAMAALAKGSTMAVFGLWVLSIAGWHAWHGTLPQAFTMGAVGFAALAANAASFGLLWSHRAGDANMRSAWICTRNDVLGNLAVLLAALGVFGTGTGWPDVLVAAIMASLALQGAFTVIRQGRIELQGAGRPNAFARRWGTAQQRDRKSVLACPWMEALPTLSVCRARAYELSGEPATSMPAGCERQRDCMV